MNATNDDDNLDDEFRLLAFKASLISGDEILNWEDSTLPVELPRSLVIQIGNHPFQDWLDYDDHRAIWEACRAALLIDPETP